MNQQLRERPPNAPIFSYDPEDPAALVGRFVVIRWRDDDYEGEVVEYDPSDDTHLVRYPHLADLDPSERDRWYNMRNKYYTGYAWDVDTPAPEREQVYPIPDPFANRVEVSEEELAINPPLPPAPSSISNNNQQQEVWDPRRVTNYDDYMIDFWTSPRYTGNDNEFNDRIHARLHVQPGVRWLSDDNAYRDAYWQSLILLESFNRYMRDVLGGGRALSAEDIESQARIQDAKNRAMFNAYYWENQRLVELQMEGRDAEADAIFNRIGFVYDEIEELIRNDALPPIPRDTAVDRAYRSYPINMPQFLIRPGRGPADQGQNQAPDQGQNQDSNQRGLAFREPRTPSVSSDNQSQSSYPSYALGDLQQSDSNQSTARDFPPPQPYRPMPPPPEWRPISEAELRASNNSMRHADGSQMTAEEKLEEKRRERLCNICMENAGDCVFVPCGHSGVCMECAGNPTIVNCPTCRTGITNKVWMRGSGKKRKTKRKVNKKRKTKRKVNKKRKTKRKANKKKNKKTRR